MQRSPVMKSNVKNLCGSCFSKVNRLFFISLGANALKQPEHICKNGVLQNFHSYCILVSTLSWCSFDGLSEFTPSRDCCSQFYYTPLCEQQMWQYPVLLPCMLGLWHSEKSLMPLPLCLCLQMWDFFPPLKIFPDYIVLQVQSLVLSVLHRAQFDMVS